MANCRSRTPSSWGSGALLVAIAVLAGCGPTPTEVGRNALAAAPVAYAATLLLIAGLNRAWRARLGDVAIPWRVHALGVAGLAIVGVIAAASTNLEWFAAAAIFVGSFQIALGLVLWRRRVLRDARGASRWPPLLASLGLLPALPLASGLLEPGVLFEVLLIPWVLGGFYGLPAAAIVAVLLLEALVRRAGSGR